MSVESIQNSSEDYEPDARQTIITGALPIISVAGLEMMACYDADTLNLLKPEVLAENGVFIGQASSQDNDGELRWD